MNKNTRKQRKEECLEAMNRNCAIVFWANISTLSATNQTFKMVSLQTLALPFLPFSSRLVRVYNIYNLLV